MISNCQALYRCAIAKLGLVIGQVAIDLLYEVEIQSLEPENPDLNIVSSSDVLSLFQKEKRKKKKNDVTKLRFSSASIQ